MIEPRDIPGECDVVVIGAGIGGLTTAALLGRAGLEVCLLESGAKPGGYIAGFERRGFSFDTAVHWLNQCGPGGMVRRVFDYIDADAPATPPMRRIKRYRGERFDYLLTNDPDDLRGDLLRDFPEDRAGLRSFFATARRLGEAFSRFGVNMRARETRTLLDNLRALFRMTAAGIPFMRVSGVPADEGLRRFFSGPILDVMWRSEAGVIACLMPVAWAYAGNYQRPPSGGSRRLVTWMAEVCDDAEVHVSYRTRAERIVLDGRRATGVRFSRDRDRGALDEIRCRHVVAACDGRIVYRDLLPAGATSPRFRERVEAAETYDSALSVFLGLDSPIENLGMDEEIVHITRSGISRAEHTGGDPEKTEINVLAPSIADPALAPAGKATLILHAPGRIEDNDHWRTGPDLARTDAYYELKQRFTDVMIDRVERNMGIDLRSRIEVCDTATPVTLGRYTGSLDGAIMGFKPTFVNVRARLARLITPVPNVLVGSQWAMVGGGLPAAVCAGANAAAYILKAQRPAAFAELRDVMDGRI
jgi:prolycopene isomerase